MTLRAEHRAPARPPGRASLRGRLGPWRGIELPLLTADASRADSLECLESTFAGDVHPGEMPEVGQDLDQPLRVLIHAATRIVGWFQLSLIHVPRRERRLVTERAQRQMDNVRPQPGMSDERRMQLKRKVGARNHRMDRKDMSTRPRARRLAGNGHAIDQQVEINPRSRAHSVETTASVRRLKAAASAPVQTWCPDFVESGSKLFSAGRILWV